MRSWVRLTTRATDHTHAVLWASRLGIVAVHEPDRMCSSVHAPQQPMVLCPAVVRRCQVDDDDRVPDDHKHDPQSRRTEGGQNHQGAKYDDEPNQGSNHRRLPVVLLVSIVGRSDA
jgi:hypothetical protein